MPRRTCYFQKRPRPHFTSAPLYNRIHSSIQGKTKTGEPLIGSVYLDSEITYLLKPKEISMPHRKTSHKLRRHKWNSCHFLKLVQLRKAVRPVFFLEWMTCSEYDQCWPNRKCGVCITAAWPLADWSKTAQIPQWAALNPILTLWLLIEKHECKTRCFHSHAFPLRQHLVGHKFHAGISPTHTCHGLKTCFNALLVQDAVQYALQLAARVLFDGGWRVWVRVVEHGPRAARAHQCEQNYDMIWYAWLPKDRVMGAVKMRWILFVLLLHGRVITLTTVWWNAPSLIYSFHTLSLTFLSTGINLTFSSGLTRNP